mmetsp:Transcript_35105/g.92176  ORF Transcript_35105/g.92176 Transcript_35105/m.92176 type:complete len:207 (+) Transcript_35105:154-774(+)
MATFLSCEQDAITSGAPPTVGAQATSRTQSVCTAGSASASSQPAAASSKAQILTRLSHPPVTRRMPHAAGAQPTALTPVLCAVKTSEDHCPSPWKLSTATLSSEEAHASRRPNSRGAQLRLLTEPSAPRYLCTSTQCCGECSFHTNTCRSYEHDARTLPNSGWAHATCQMGPSWPTSSAVCCRCAPSTTSNILMRRSEPALASCLP